jgi:hypothetical protein
VPLAQQTQDSDSSEDEDQEENGLDENDSFDSDVAEVEA